MNTANLVADYCELAEILRETPTYEKRDIAHGLIAKMLGYRFTKHERYAPTQLRNRESARAHADVSYEADAWEFALDHFDFFVKKGHRLAGVITSPYGPIDVGRFCRLNDLLCVEIPGCWWRAKTYVILPNDDIGLADAAVITAAFGLEVTK